MACILESDSSKEDVAGMSGWMVWCMACLEIERGACGSPIWYHDETSKSKKSKVKCNKRCAFE